MSRDTVRAVIRFQNRIFCNLRGKNMSRPLKVSIDGTQLETCKIINGRKTRSLFFGSSSYEIWVSLPQFRAMIDCLKGLPVYQNELIEEFEESEEEEENEGEAEPSTPVTTRRRAALQDEGEEDEGYPETEGEIAGEEGGEEEDEEGGEGDEEGGEGDDEGEVEIVEGEEEGEEDSGRRVRTRAVYN